MVIHPYRLTEAQRSKINWVGHQHSPQSSIEAPRRERRTQYTGEMGMGSVAESWKHPASQAELEAPGWLNRAGMGQKSSELE